MVYEKAISHVRELYAEGDIVENQSGFLFFVEAFTVWLMKARTTLRCSLHDSLTVLANELAMEKT